MSQSPIKLTFPATSISERALRMDLIEYIKSEKFKQEFLSRPHGKNVTYKEVVLGLENMFNCDIADVEALWTEVFSFLPRVERRLIDRRTKPQKGGLKKVGPKRTNNISGRIYNRVKALEAEIQSLKTILQDFNERLTKITNKQQQ